MKKKKKNIYYYLFYFWIILLFTLTSIPKLPTPIKSELGIDKIAHFSVYLLLIFFYYKKNEDLQFKVLLRRILLILIFVPLLDELHQIPIPGRHFSIYDIIADILGILVMIFVIVLRSWKKGVIEN